MKIRKKFSESFYFLFRFIKKPQTKHFKTRMLFWKYLRRFNIEIFFKINWEIKKNKTKLRENKKQSSQTRKKKKFKRKTKIPGKTNQNIHNTFRKNITNILHASYFKRRYFSLHRITLSWWTLYIELASNLSLFVFVMMKWTVSD